MIGMMDGKENEMIERPNIVREQHLSYLDRLRESGATNMYGAGAYVIGRFGVNKAQAKEIVLYWMKSFEERMKEK